MAELKVEYIVVSSCATNCYLCYDSETKKGFIVDPGDAPDRIKAKLARLDFTPEAIVITHGHFDHIAATPELKAAYNVPVIALDEEKNQLSDSSLNMTMQYGEYPVSIKADKYVHDGDELELCGHKAKFIHTPGHTPGGMCLYFEADKILISGDTLFNESLGRYDFPGGNGRQIIDSIVNKLFKLPEDTVVYPGHGDATTIEHELIYNPCARFIGKI